MRLSKWIWNRRDPKSPDQYVYLRKEIVKEGGIGRVEIRVTASDQYQLYINGQWVGMGPSPSNPAFPYYDTYRITIEESTAVLAAECYCIGQDTQMVTEQNKGFGGFRLELEGEGLLVVTDDSWQATDETGHFKDYLRLGSSRISNWSGYKETFLAAKEPAGWKESGFSGVGFHPAVTLAEMEQTFLPREIPFLRRDAIYPVSIVQVEPYLGRVENPDALLSLGEEATVVDASMPQSFPSIVIDFGKEVVGYLEIDVEGGPDCSMAVWYGESLELARTDALIMDGKRRVYAPYHRRAFRFLKLTFNNGTAPIRIYAVRIQAVRYDYEHEGTFTCSDETLNRIFEVSRYTVQLASQEHFEDSVWREGMQWLADARVMSLVNYWVFGDRRISRKAIRQFFCNQLEDGKVPASGPQPFSSTTVDFDLHLIMMCREYYEYTMDMALIQEVEGPLRKLMQKLNSIKKQDLLSIEVDTTIGVFLDWALVDRRDRITAVNCFYHKALRDYAFLQGILGHEQEQKLYEEEADSLRDLINATLFDPARGLYMDCLTDEGLSAASSQQTNLIAVYSGVVAPHEERALIERVYASTDIERIKGAFLLSFMVDLLFQKGFEEQAVAMVRDYWGEMLNRGATTWWETFDRETPPSCIPSLYSQNSATSYMEYIPCSHCHGWGSGPAFFLMKNILGIHPLTPGFETVEFRPYTEGLDYARGTAYTPMGTIRVNWRKRPDGTIESHIHAPESMHIVKRRA